MKTLLSMLILVSVLTGCIIVPNHSVPPGHDPNGPGNSENAPGHNKNRY